MVAKKFNFYNTYNVHYKNINKSDLFLSCIHLPGFIHLSDIHPLWFKIKYIILISNNTPLYIFWKDYKLFCRDTKLLETIIFKKKKINKVIIFLKKILNFNYKNISAKNCILINVVKH